MLLFLFALIAASLIAQTLLSDSSNQTAGGTIAEEAGAVSMQGAPQTTQPGAGGPGLPAGGSAGNDFGSGAAAFLTNDFTAANTISSGGEASGPGNAPAPGAPGSLAGRVVSGAAPVGAPIGRITVYLAGSNGIFTGASAKTAGDGSFRFTNLAPADYKVFFFDSTGAWKSAWYGSPAPGGSPVHVAGGSETDISQALMPAEPTGGAIAGRVTDGFGKGVAGVDVLAYFVDEAAGVQLLFKAEAVTDENGDYIIAGLPPSGPDPAKATGYKIQFLPSGGFASQWFSGQPTYRTAKLIEVDAGKTAGGIDACLGEGGTISGRVTIEGGNKPAAYVLVDIFDEAGVIVDTQITGAGGSYQSDMLPAGTYRLRVTPHSSSGYAGEWYNDRKDFASADRIFVLSGKNSSGIDINLDPPAPEPPEPPALHGNDAGLIPAGPAGPAAQTQDAGSADNAAPGPESADNSAPPTASPETSPPGTAPPGTSPPGTSPPGSSTPGTSPPGISPPGSSPGSPPADKSASGKAGQNAAPVAGQQQE